MKKQVIILIIPKGENWHYLTVKKSISIIKKSRWILLFDLPSCFPNKRKSESHKKVCEVKDFCRVIMPSELTKILEFNQYQKFDKAPFIIDADLECIIEKIDGCKTNPEKPSAAKVSIFHQVFPCL